MSTFPSTSGERITNNVMRHEYRTLTEEEKGQVKAVKDTGLVFLDILHQIGDTNPNGERQGSRELALAQTKMGEAVMWAVKHITR